MGLICLATRTLMLARGTKYNTFRNITQGVTWTGLHMGAEILFWLTMTVFGQYLLFWDFIECGRNHKEFFAKGNDVCECLRSPKRKKKFTSPVLQGKQSQNESYFRLTEQPQQELEPVISAQIQDCSRYPLGQSEHVPLQQCLMQNSNQSHSLSGHILQQLNQLAVHMLCVIFLLHVSRLTATFLW